MTCFDEHMSQTRAGGYEAVTRAWSIPDGYEPYDDGDQTIGIAFTQNDVAPKMGHFFKGSGGNWRTNIEINSAGNYFLYGYIPHVSTIKYEISSSSTPGDNSSYNAGAVMTLRDVPSVMPHDLCVVIGAKDGFDRDHDGHFTDENSNSKYDEGVDTRTDRLRMGDFAYHTNPTKGGEEGDAESNFVFLLFDHLYAALSVNIRVYGEYANLRTIKLKSLQLSTMEDEDVSLDKTNITVSLEANDGSTSPIKSITYEPTGAPLSESVEFWSSASGEPLTTDYQPFTGHFMPENVTTLILTSVYDVYDTKGNLIRENCKATNTLVLKNLFSGQTKTLRGSKYTVNMTIQPTYLYMLSEPDLDNPTMVIN